MIYGGTHRTSYTYSEPVFLEPHVLRLRPRSDPRQTIRSFSVEFRPEPDGVTEGIDVYGNDVVWAWFSGMHSALYITTQFVVETLRDNPYDFVVPTPEAAMLPPVYAQADRLTLAPYLQAASPEEVGALAAEVAVASGRELVSFLRELVGRIHAACRTIVRLEGDPLPAEATLDAGEGSCRDLAVLFMEACRHAGVAARFVSGYLEGAPEQPHDLHAWAAAYVPGAGWRGYDPTVGLAVSDRHVTLAAARHPSGAAPVEGRFRGTGVRSELTSTIEMHQVEE